MKILVVAPHADDEVLGLGGTIARYADEGRHVVVAVLTGHGLEEPHPLWPREAWDLLREEAKQAHALLGVRETIFEEIPAVGVADQAVWKLNRTTMDLVKRVEPDVLYVPFLYDVHKDHRELTHSFSVAWRPCTDVGRKIREVFAYETVSETHWNLPYLEPAFCPNQWVDVGPYLDKKLRAFECYKSQIRSFPDARSLEAVEALARWRGCQMGLRAAEAFVTIRRVSTLSMNGRDVPASLERSRADDRRESSIAPRPGPAV